MREVMTLWLLCRSWSVDDTLYTSPNSPLTPSKPRSRGVFGSFERGLDRMRNLLTPSKRRSPEKGEPRRIKNSCNISNVGHLKAQQLLSILRDAISKMNFDVKEKGFSIRCEATDTRSKKILFKMEVCYVYCSNNQNALLTGIRRKRLKGDVFFYKRVCEDIIRSLSV